ncbi:MAG: glycosyltransferase [Deltaproteobacteria bacterium]|nr:glycosyltransferase [Deltaproteobacteria bacterium]MBN2670468.1 glycosyltransferase [Deltaproteobacteria bacterium]
MIKSNETERELVALITNHGYAGPKPPIGNAPDTGGQNVYVNDLAMALEEVGYDVYVYTRGGFPEFDSTLMREGEAKMSDYVRYVYIPGGGDEFLPKEEIGIALGEQVEHLYEHINGLGQQMNRKPWDVFEFINTHYWDAGVLGYELVERWQADFIFERIQSYFGDKLDKKVVDDHYRERHLRAVRHNWQYLIGRLALRSYGVDIDVNDSPSKMHKQCMSALEQIDPGLRRYSVTLLSRLQRAHWPVFTINKTTVASVAVGHLLADFLGNMGVLCPADIYKLNRHFWTPHSLAPIKERNYLEYGWDRKRSLQFVERKHHERVVCERTPLVVSTSEAISKTLVSHFNVHPDRIIYFPPCVNNEYRPRVKEDCAKGYASLSIFSDVPDDTLRASKIIIEASRADHTKRKDLVIQGFAGLADDMQDTYLFVFGGPKNEVYRELHGIIGDNPALAGRAFLVPETISFDTLVQIFSLADLYVSASEMEGFGMSVLQAASAGVPIVSSRLIPYTTMYLRGIAGVAQTQTPEAYTEQMKKLLTRGDDNGEMKRKLVDAAADFSWRVRVKDLHEAEHEPVIILAENRHENYVVRLGEQQETDMLGAAHMYRSAFINDADEESAEHPRWTGPK